MTTGVPAIVSVWPMDAVWLPMRNAGGDDEPWPDAYDTGAMESTEEPIDTVAGATAVG